jgi:GTP cyclohydrolase II
VPRTESVRLSPAADQKRRLEELAERLRDPAEISDDGRIVVEAKTVLPSESGDFDVRLFRFEDDPAEHLAISCGDLSGDAPVAVRLHSECFTGEVLGSKKCDCAPQLEFALQTIQKEGRGVVVYLRQEGRGIGLANKLKAYELQRAGADTVDANRLLGLPDDSRRYDAAAAVLKHLGVKTVRLMTNNPAKVDALQSLGLTIAERMPVLVAQHSQAVEYLHAKRDRMGHHVPQLSVIRALIS